MKSEKSKLLHNLEGNIVPSEKPLREDSVYICDGNALLQALTGIPETFEDVTEKVLNVLPRTNRVDFVTDSYHPNSINSFERYRRGSSSTFYSQDQGPKLLRNGNHICQTMRTRRN